MLVDLQLKFQGLRCRLTRGVGPCIFMLHAYEYTLGQQLTALSSDGEQNMVLQLVSRTASDRWHRFIIRMYKEIHKAIEVWKTQAQAERRGSTEAGLWEDRVGREDVARAKQLVEG